MINDIFEFFFCPVHGLLRMEMLPWVTAGVTGVVTACRKLVRR